MIDTTGWRCPECGSYAIRDREVPPLPGSVTVGPELEVTCKERTCGRVVTGPPAQVRDTYLRHLRSESEMERLDREALYHRGLVVGIDPAKARRDANTRRWPW